MQTLPPPLAGMGMFRQFLNYRTSVQPDGKIKKEALGRGGWRVAPNDPSEWMTFEEAAATGKPIAFSFSENDPFFFLDIDHALEEGGGWNSLARDLCDKFVGCAMEVSVSGKGLHIFGIGNSDLPRNIQDDDLGLGFYTHDRFVALTGTNAMGDCLVAPPQFSMDYAAGLLPKNANVQSFDWSEGPCDEWRGPLDDDDLVRRAKRVESAGHAFGFKASFADLWDRNVDVLAKVFPPDGNKGDPFNSSRADSALAAHLAFWTGRDCERIKRLMLASTLRRDKFEREDYLVGTIVKACGLTENVCRDKELQPVVADVPESGKPEVLLVSGSTYVKPEDQIKLFDGCVYIRSQNRVWIPSGEILKPEAFKVMFGGFKFVIDDQGKCTGDAFAAFTQSPLIRCPQVATVGFDPNHAAGSIMRNYRGRQALNTWVEPVVDRTPGDTTRFHNHMTKLLPDANDRAVLLAWMAACVQYPGRKFTWSPVIQGVEGNGKSLFSYALEYAVSPTYTHWPRVIDLKNPQFNAWMDQCLLACVEDVYSSNADFFENLKPLITGETQTVEKKGVDAGAVKVFVNLIFNMNGKTGLRKSRNDRRLAIFYTAQQDRGDLTRDGLNDEYFRSLYEWCKYGGGFAAVAHELATYKIPEHLDPAKLATRAPNTTATREAVAASLGAREQTIQNAIDSDHMGFRGGWVSSMYALELLQQKSRFQVTLQQLDGLMTALDFVRHPAMGAEGRPNNKVMPDNSRSRLYVHKGRFDLLAATSNAEAARLYSEAQNAN